MSSRIEQIIEEIEEYIDSCKFQPLSTTKIIVNKYHMDNATRDANDIRIGAIRYTDDLLANAESIIGHTLDSYTTKYDGLVNSLQECYDRVHNNRQELEVPDQNMVQEEPVYEEAEEIPEVEEPVYEEAENVEYKE